MQGHKHFTDKASPQFRLSERVPRYNLYHRLRELLDWDFLYQETQSLYGSTGRPSLDPVVFFKLLLVGRLANIISDRRLVSQCALRLDILYFLGYEVDEDLPWHSTISRTRQRYPSSVFERLFDTDPEARISVKPGKARALNYLCSLAVDTAHGLITHVQADLADSRDSLHLPRLLTGLQQRFCTHELTLRDLLTDAGYANGSNYAFLEQQRVTAWIPVFGQYKPVVAGFTYDAGTDSLTCPATKTLSFNHYEISTDRGWVKLYSAAYADCKQCPRKPTCIAKAKCKRLTRTIYDAAYQRAWQRQQSCRRQYLRRVRQRTIEPVFGTLLHHYGLRRLNPRGLASAHKTMLLTALAYNLKKLLTHRPRRTQQLAVSLPLPRLPTIDQPWAQAA